MSDVNEWVVREFFEQQGYMVSEPCKYTVGGRRARRAEEDIDLLVLNPTVKKHTLPTSFVWGVEDLSQVGAAVVGIRGGHSHRFYASTFKNTPEVVRFAQPRSSRLAARVLGTNDFARILCLPKLPASKELRSRTEELLRHHGISGVMPFPTMLAEIIHNVDQRQNYDKSDLLQIIRILKSYDLIRDSQLELFSPRRRSD